MKKKTKKVICFLGILAILVILAGLIIIWVLPDPQYVYYTTYCKDYYSVIANTKSRDYNQIIEVNGEPDRIIREKNAGDNYIIQLEYDDGRMFAFIDYGEENRSLCRMEMTNPEYRFGKKEIGVGTAKSTIEKVYSNSYRGLQQDVYGKYFVEDGNFSIYFYFDTNEDVYKIVVGKAEIMHGTHGWKEVSLQYLGGVQAYKEDEF